MNDLLHIVQNIVNQIPIPPSRTYLVIVSEAKAEIGLAVQAFLLTRGFETYFVRLSPKIEHGLSTLQGIVSQVINSNSGIIVLLQPEHAFFLFDTFGRPDMGFKQPMKYIYCDWLMPVDTLKRTLSADYCELQQFKSWLLTQVKSANEIFVSTANGTEVTLYPRNWLETDGEVFCTPFESSTKGKIFVDACAYWAPPKMPFTLWIYDGRVVGTREIETEDPQHQNVFQDLHRDLNSNFVSEFGIGINPNALWNEPLMESEQARGTCHFGFGHNKNYGGAIDSKYHFDLVIQKPTIVIDGDMICNEGVFLS